MSSSSANLAAKISHHPETDMLVEYASGSLPWAVTIAVAAHAQLCPKCRDQVATLNKIGTSEFSGGTACDVKVGTFEHLMKRVQSAGKEIGVEPAETASRPSRAVDPYIKGIELPKAIKKLVGNDLGWRRSSPSLQSATLKCGQADYELAFQKICRGGKVVEHDHKGLEVTLVLDGSFSDESGMYQRGDFIVRQPGQVHRPIATQNSDCLCLSVSEAPVKVTGIMGWLINPFLRLNPA